MNSGPETNQASARNAQALKTARECAATIKCDLIAKGELVPADVLGQALGLSRRAIHEAAKAGRMFAIEAGGGEHYYPAFLADQDLRTHGPEDVLSILASASGWNKWLFFTTPSGALGSATPLEALRERRREAVQTAARAYIEH